MLSTFEKTQAHEARRAAIQRQMEAMEAAAAAELSSSRSVPPAGSNSSGSSAASGGAPPRTTQRRASASSGAVGSLETARRFLWDEDEDEIATNESGQPPRVSVKRTTTGPAGIEQTNLYPVTSMDLASTGGGGGMTGGHLGKRSQRGLWGMFGTSTYNMSIANMTTVDLANPSPDYKTKLANPGKTPPTISEKQEYRPNCLTLLYLCFRQILLGAALTMTGCWTWMRTRWAMAMGNGRGRRCGLVLAIVLVVVIPVVIFTPSNNNNSDNATNNGTRSSSKSRSGGPSNKQRLNDIRSSIVSLGLSAAQDFEEKTSPQSQALDWIATKDPARLEMDDPFILPRYALAVFYYSTHGDAMYQSIKIKETQTIPPQEEIKDKPVEYRFDNYNGTASQPEAKQQRQKVIPEFLKPGQVQEMGDNFASQPKWINEENWMTGKGYCSWYGIACHHRPGSSVLNTKYDDNAGMIAFNLTENNVRGRVPAEVLLAMPDLRYISLSGNGFFGTVPPEIGGCQQLKYLSFSNNIFTGTLPAEVFSIHGLEYLSLDGNNFMGRLPIGLGKMTNLIDLDINSNFFSGTIPHHISFLENLTDIYMDVNHFSGTIPSSIAKLTKLEDLRLRHNRLVGPIPSELGTLSRLEVLYLDRNSLTGTIPSTFGQQTRLNELHLYNNKLSGPIPTELGTMKELDSLYLDNNHLTGGIPTEFGLLNDLDDFYLHKNYLNGTLPSEIGNMENLRNFRIYTNGFVGTVPTEIGNAFKLEDLYIQDNMFSGNIPEQVAELTRLVKFRLYWNKFEGEVSAKICNLEENKLIEFKSDCAGDTPKFKCPCCTACFE